MEKLLLKIKEEADAINRRREILIQSVQLIAPSLGKKEEQLLINTLETLLQK